MENLITAENQDLYEKAISLGYKANIEKFYFNIDEVGSDWDSADEEFARARIDYVLNSNDKNEIASLLIHFKLFDENTKKNYDRILKTIRESIQQ